MIEKVYEENRKYIEEKEELAQIIDMINKRY